MHAGVLLRCRAARLFRQRLWSVCIKSRETWIRLRGCGFGEEPPPWTVSDSLPAATRLTGRSSFPLPVIQTHTR